MISLSKILHQAYISRKATQICALCINLITSSSSKFYMLSTATWVKENQSNFRFSKSTKKIWVSSKLSESKKMRIAYDCRSFCQSPSREQPSNICHLTLGGTTDCLISISVYTFSNLQLLVNCSAGFVAVTLWPPRCGLYCQCSSFFTVLCCFPLC